MAKRILVADDSATIQKAFAMVFAGQDVSLMAARSLDEAVAAAKQGKPDLVIADAALGSSTGYDLCAILKADGATRNVPVLILSSMHVPYDEGRGHKVGASGNIVKPFESTSLIEQVTNAFSARAAVPVPTPVMPQAALPTRQPLVPAGDDEEYGEFTIERSSGSRQAPTGFHRSPPSSSSSRPPAVNTGGSSPNLRPSLIPGVRPGVPSRPGAPPAAPASTMPTRTIMGMPTPNVQARQAPSAPPARPQAPAPKPRTPAPIPSAPRSAPYPAVPAAISDAVAQKVASMASRGPEYEALAKLSREVIEQVVWEIVPELAEVIIRQEIDRLANAKR